MTGVRGSHVAVVGGSIAGTAMAIALAGSGCHVTVFERSSGELHARGFGIGIPLTVRDEFVRAGVLDPGMPALRCAERIWIVHDGSHAGRVVWRQPFLATLNNWGVLWRTLRARVPADVTWRTATVTGVEPSAEDVGITAGDRQERFDVVVGADGYRSEIRRMIGLGHPRYAGYSLWRGTFAADRLATIPAELQGHAITIGFPGGHAIAYLIPDHGGHGTLVNWGIYSTLAVPPDVDVLASVPPGGLSDEQAGRLDRLLEEHFPPQWAELIRQTGRSELAMQPIYDLAVSRYAAGRTLLAGDAGALTRPHVGAGVTKAVQDALAIRRLSGEHDDWTSLLAGYDHARTAPTAALVELGRRIGTAQVERTPPWSSMTSEDYEKWFRSTAVGQSPGYWS